ncbi:MAG TPA: DMT family transporter [Albidovulum sp.]|uniref:DMT family transporter n=1 Tax=Albidovulum sp. TaxID=1872424 RepID=UPI002D0A7545|nr:DMT family transporter [Albidovulum sp.]
MPSAAGLPERLGPGTVVSLLVVATLTALCYPLLSVGLAYAPPLQFAALRAGIAGLVLLLLAAVLRRPFPQGKRVWLLVALSGLSTTSIGFSSMFGAAGLIAPGIATVVAGTQPIVAALLALAMFGQPFGKREFIGMSVALAGIAMMTLQDIAAGGTSAVAGSALVIAATFGTAFGNAVTKRFAADVDPFAAAALQLLFGAVPLAVLAYFTESWTPRVLEPGFLMIVAALAIGGTAITQTLWIGVLGHCPLNTANAFTFVAPLLGVAISVVFLGERLIPLGAFGMALTVGGIVLAARRR